MACSKVLDAAAVSMYHKPAPEPARPGSKTPSLTMPTSTTAMSVCPKCGTIKNSGRLSCCARGGAWFKSCGDVGDTQFDHTWTEGIRACKSTLSTGCDV